MRPEELRAFSQEVNRHLDTGRGVRVGETALASRRVHMIDPTRPGFPVVRCAADAGRVFYGRCGVNDIVHLDIFHSISDVDHTLVARAVRRAAEAFAFDMSLMPEPWAARPWLSGNMADFIDIQTGTGGGRATGSLKFGKKTSLRMAHRGHVHVAGLIPPEAVALIYYLVREVEKAIQLCGAQLRRVDGVLNDSSSGGAPVDLSPYSAQTDSLLRDSNSGEGQSERPAMMKQALDAATDFGSVGALQSFLECVGNPGRRESPYARLEREFGDAEGILSRLRALEICDGDGASLALTDKGRALRDFLRRFAREVETQMRKMIRRGAKPAAIPLEKSDFTAGRAEGLSLGTSRMAFPALEVDFRGDIAVPETITAWASRCAREGGVLPIDRRDLMVERRRRRPKIDICLLIDASASMAGRRIQAAKHLARYLFLTCRDRVSVVTFQDRSVTQHVVRARSHQALEAGLATVRPAGLTPLAAGIVEAVRLLGAARRRPTLLVLLTDGIPTMNQWTGDPARDALTAAEQIARSGLPFACIGLAPNKGFLRKLTEIARGTLYIVDEFDRDLLARLVKDERDRVQT